MEKASDGSFARITRKTAVYKDDEDEKNWDRALNSFYGFAKPASYSRSASAS
jgi:hypothetical protein